MKTQKLLTYLRKCIHEYDLIHENDSIMVGLSGGKDSLVLLYGLKLLQSFYPIPYSVKACTIDPGFSMDYTPLYEFCEKINVPFHVEKTEIAQIVFEARKEENPCALCSNMRRGSLTALAEQENCNLIALGHHKDDYLSTLMLSLFYEGRFYSFAPKTFYEDRKINIIRPMLYIPEGAVVRFAAENNFPVVKSLCPADKSTKRAEMSLLIKDLCKDHPDFKDRLFHALVHSHIPDWTACNKEN